jgi:CheY-like chemotaxis protein
MSRKLMNQKTSVLIIEDDHDIRVVFRDLLESQNFEIYSATNGRDALEILNTLTDPPSLIISDLMMPLMDGNEFVREKNKCERYKDIPVLMVSANIEKILVTDVGILPKPVDLQTFVHTVCEYVA